MDPHKGGSLIIAADKRILDGFEATTTMVDWKSYKCKRVVRSSLAGETQACVETAGHVGIHQSVLLCWSWTHGKPE